jgi:hypothetical protein
VLDPSTAEAMLLFFLAQRYFTHGVVASRVQG